MSSLEIKPIDSQRTTEITTVPKLPFSMYISAQKSGGKTTLLLNMLLNKQLLYQKFNEIYWFSPTSRLDEKIRRSLDDKNLTTPNKDLYKLIKRMQQKNILDDGTSKEIPSIKEQRDNIEYIDTLDEKMINEIINSNRIITERFGKRFSNKTLIILDDMIESRIFKTESFKKLVFKSRHYNVSIITTSQSYFQLPKAIRLNNTYTVLFETGSRKEIETIYEENNAGIKFKEFYAMYLDLMKKPFNFLLINYNNPKHSRFCNAFENIVDLEQYKGVK